MVRGATVSTVLPRNLAIRPIFDRSRSRMTARKSSPSFRHQVTVTASIGANLPRRAKVRSTPTSDRPLTSSKGRKAHLRKSAR
jgi:hypothetical protein